MCIVYTLLPRNQSCVGSLSLYQWRSSQELAGLKGRYADLCSSISNIQHLSEISYFRVWLQVSFTQRKRRRTWANKFLTDLSKNFSI